MRKCRSRSNKIVLNNVGKGEGFYDRMYIINHVVNIAGYLCARVEITRPYFMLGTQHNNGSRLDPNMLWSEFRTFDFLDGSGSSVVDFADLKNLTKQPTLQDVYGATKYDK
jgi:hypothetical protein